jgi:hypothetical protein
MLNAVENKRQVALTQLVDPKFDLSRWREMYKNIYINSCRDAASRAQAGLAHQQQHFMAVIILRADYNTAYMRGCRA